MLRQQLYRPAFVERLGHRLAELHVTHSERQFTTITGDGFVRAMGWLTVFMSNTTMALVQYGTLLGPRRFDMGNSD